MGKNIATKISVKVALLLSAASMQLSLRALTATIAT